MRRIPKLICAGSREISVQPIWADFGLLTLVLMSACGYERTSSASLLNVWF